MIKEYNRSKAVEYARKWALGRNSEFGDFSAIGGDCTNYISQCLYAGGGVMNYSYAKGWFYQSLSKRSPSWTSVAYLQNFLLRKENTMGPYGKIVALNEVEEGDIIQLKQNPMYFNHTVIVTKKVGNDIFVCAHTNDALDKPLNRYYYQALMPIHIQGVYI